MSPGREVSETRARTSKRIGRFIRKIWPFASAVILVSAILSHTLAAHFDAKRPHWALALRRADANAELKIANDAITRHAEFLRASPGTGNQPESEKFRDVEALHERIARALRAEPLNARGLELLGVLSAPSDSAKADIFMRAALKRSLRSPAALYWMMHRRFAEGNIVGSAAFADALLRIRPSSMSVVGPVLLQIAAKVRGREGIINALAQAPPWRKSFFHFLNSNIGNDPVVLKMLVGLKPSAHPPTDQEIASYLWALVDKKRFELAYYTWLQFLQPEKAKVAGLLFNGDFAFPPSQAPFDWSIRGGGGANAEIVHAAMGLGKNNLAIEFGGGRANFHPISQLLTLPPGKYKFSGVAKGKLDGPRGLQWQLACLAPISKVVAETPMMLGVITEWTEFATRFDVPQGCDAQTLRLFLDARSISETLLFGAVSFADLKIARD